MAEPRSRPRRARATAAVAGLLVSLLAGLAAACSYGFEGGGFPSHIQTIYIAPFENETPQFDLEQRLFDELIDELPAKLGLRAAGEETADAILRGTIRRYDDVAQAYRAGDATQTPDILSHEVQIGITAELVDVRDNVIRWSASSLIGRGTYRPDTETDERGKAEAIENIIEQIIDGAQSQW